MNKQQPDWAWPNMKFMQGLVLTTFLSGIGMYIFTAGNFRIFIWSFSLGAMAIFIVYLLQLLKAKEFKSFREKPVQYVGLRLLIMVGALTFSLWMLDFGAKPITAEVDCLRVRNGDGFVVEGLEVIDRKSYKKLSLNVSSAMANKLKDLGVLTGPILARDGCSRPITVEYLPVSQMLLDVN